MFVIFYLILWRNRKWRNFERDQFLKVELFAREHWIFCGWHCCGYDTVGNLLRPPPYVYLLSLLSRNFQAESKWIIRRVSFNFQITNLFQWLRVLLSPREITRNFWQLASFWLSDFLIFPDKRICPFLLKIGKWFSCKNRLVTDAVRNIFHYIP